MRDRKEYELICIECGIPFIAFSNKALRCPDCKAKHKRVPALGGRKNYKRLSKAAKMSIEEVLRTLKKYNRENGTRHSYGQFVSLIERGVIDVD